MMIKQGLNFLSLMNLETENTFISPFSLDVALSLLSFGASGETLNEIKKFIKVSTDDIYSVFAGLNEPSNNESGYIFKSANSIWGNVLQPQYKKDIVLQAETDVYDLREGKEINAWIKRKTNGLIHDMEFPSVDPGYDVYVINVIYFKGLWENQFKPEATVETNFETLNAKTVACQMMKQTRQFEYAEKANIGQLISLPYKKTDNQRSVEAIVFLPEPGKSVASFLRQPEELEELLKEKQMTQIELGLPKFKVEATHNEMLQMLHQLGLQKIMSPQAELDNMITRSPATVSKIVQKVFVEVDEKGTEAAVATSIHMARCMPREMICDRPFIFGIRDVASEQILFLGIVGNSAHLT